MSRTAVTRETQPLGEINMTPLIDVMLVLLIMFIITIPIQSHAVKLDLPSSKPLPQVLDPVKNKIVITANDAILWNAEPVSVAELRLLVARTQQLSPTPELHLEPAPDARYAIVDEVLAATKAAKAEKMGFVGNERYRDF